MGASESGTAIVKGHEVVVDASFSDILENLQFGAMGLVMARKGNWGFGGDALWMALGANGTTPGPLALTASVDANQGAFAFYGLRRLAPYADLLFGARVNVIQMGLRANGPGQFSVDGSKTWVDPIAGVLLRTPESGKRWHAQVYTEIGGFGAGSDFTWQVFPTVGVNVGKDDVDRVRLPLARPRLHDRRGPLPVHVGRPRPGTRGGLRVQVLTMSIRRSVSARAGPPGRACLALIVWLAAGGTAFADDPVEGGLARD